MNQACFYAGQGDVILALASLRKKEVPFYRKSQKGGDDEKKEDVSRHFSFSPVSAVLCHDAANLNEGSTGHRPCCEVIRSCMHLRGDRSEDTGYPGENRRCIRGKGRCE